MSNVRRQLGIYNTFTEYTHTEESILKKNKMKTIQTHAVAKMVKWKVVQIKYICRKSILCGNNIYFPLPFSS